MGRGNTTDFQRSKLKPGTFCSTLSPSLMFIFMISIHLLTTYPLMLLPTTFAPLGPACTLPFLPVPSHTESPMASVYFSTEWDVCAAPSSERHHQTRAWKFRCTLAAVGREYGRLHWAVCPPCFTIRSSGTKWAVSHPLMNSHCSYWWLFHQVRVARGVVKASVFESVLFMNRDFSVHSEGCLGGKWRHIWSENEHEFIF